MKVIKIDRFESTGFVRGSTCDVCQTKVCSREEPRAVQGNLDIVLAADPAAAATSPLQFLLGQRLATNEDSPGSQLVDAGKAACAETAESRCCSLAGAVDLDLARHFGFALKQALHVAFAEPLSVQAAVLGEHILVCWP